MIALELDNVTVWFFCTVLVYKLGEVDMQVEFHQISFENYSHICRDMGSNISRDNTTTFPCLWYHIERYTFVLGSVVYANFTITYTVKSLI